MQSQRWNLSLETRMFWLLLNEDLSPWTCDLAVLQYVLEVDICAWSLRRSEEGKTAVIHFFVNWNKNSLHRKHSSLRFSSLQWSRATNELLQRSFFIPCQIMDPKDLIRLYVKLFWVFQIFSKTAPPIKLCGIQFQFNDSNCKLSILRCIFFKPYWNLRLSTASSNIAKTNYKGTSITKCDEEIRSVFQKSPRDNDLNFCI